MLLMLKLLATTLLLSSLASAQSTSDKIVEYLNEQYSENSNIESITIKPSAVVPTEFKDWKAYVIDLEAKLKNNPNNLIKQRDVWFSNGEVITKQLTSLKSGSNLIDDVKLDFKAEYYKKENLIYGNENAKHKVAIFSDPLCPFCRGFVPGAIEDMKKDPKKFAIYYYHFPLPRIHPASVPLVKAAVAAEHKGYKDVVLKLYNVQVDPREQDINKVMAAFNKAVGSTLVPQDLQTPAVAKQIQFDLEIANMLMVGGTPTLYLDDKIDRTKKKYQKIK